MEPSPVHILASLRKSLIDRKPLTEAQDSQKSTDPFANWENTGLSRTGLSEGLCKMMGEQVTAELYSSNLYLAMAAWFDDKNLGHFAAYFYKKAEEERVHALKFIKYIAERRSTPPVAAIDSPRISDCKAPADFFSAALDHEIIVTELIGKLLTEAKADDDHAAYVFLQDFAKEQVEEIDEADRNKMLVTLASSSPATLILFERSFGA